MYFKTRTVKLKSKYPELKWNLMFISVIQPTSQNISRGNSAISLKDLQCTAQF